MKFEQVLEKFKSDSESWLLGDMYTVARHMDYCDPYDTSKAARQQLGALMGDEIEDESPIDSVVSANIAHAFESGIAAVARIIGIEPHLLVAACNDAYDDEEIKGASIELLMRRIDESKEWAKYYKKKLGD